MQVQAPLVSIISVNFNQTQVTLDMIRSVLENSYGAKELILVDNGSQEDIGSLVPAEVKYIRSERNLGFSGGNNLAIPQAKGKYLFFINNDTVLTEGCIHTLVNYLETHPKAGMVSPLICYDLNQTGGKETIQFAGMTALHTLTGRNMMIGRLEENKGQFNEPTHTAYVHGAAMMVRAEILPEVGLMDDHFFLYYEEMDWSARVSRKGYEVLTIPTAKIYHRESLSVGEDSPLKTYFQTRNRIYFVRRNFSFWSKVIFFLFFGLITVPKNLLAFALKGKTKRLIAFCDALLHHLSPGHKNEFENLLVRAKS